MGGYAVQKKDSHLGQVKADGTRFHRTTQNSYQFKTYEFFISGILHLILLASSWLWVMKILDNKTVIKERLV